MVKKYPSRVAAVRNPLEGIYIVALESLGRPYAYLPGQFLHLALDPYNPSAPWPESRCFSIQSAPADGGITLTYAVKGNFTRRMERELAPGKELVLKLPYGELFSKGYALSRCVFIAGGTGVTPFLSLFADPAFASCKDPALWLGVRDERYHIYGPELASARERNPAFVTHIVCQDREGILDIGAIHSAEGQDANYFISGPPDMIRNFKAYLLAKGLPPESVRTDDWE